MPKLEKIYKIENLSRKHEALVEYAQNLKIHLSQVLKENGGYDYDKLTVLIYDAEKIRYKLLKKNTFIFCAGIALFMVLSCCIYLFFVYYRPGQ